MQRKPLPRLASIRTLERLALQGEHGRHWYRHAASEVGAAARKLGISPVRFSDLLAIMSPRVSVRKNIGLTLAYLAGDRSEKPAGCLAAVWAAVRHYERTGEIRGPKTSAFAKAIRGDYRAVVLDVWMARAFGVEQSEFSRPAVHREAAKRIRNVAKRLGWAPAEVQAAIWTAVATLPAGMKRTSSEDKRYRTAPQFTITDHPAFPDVAAQTDPDLHLAA